MLGIDIEVLAPHDFGCKRHEMWGGIQVSRFPYFYPLRFQRLCYGAGILKNIKQNPVASLQLPFFVLFEIAYALWIARKRKVDLVHAHWSIPQGFTGLLLREVFGIPCVISLHGSDIYGLGSPLVRSLNAKVILGAKVCTANSYATAKIARDLSGREDIQIIPMGVDMEVFRQATGGEALHCGLGREGKTILYAGRLIEWKGVEYLIRALPEVIGKHPEAKLVVVGSGPYKRDLVSVTETLNLQDKVTFLNAVSQEELVRYYSIADVFVLPSIVNDEGETEGLGVVLLEAMASGVPVIGTDVGGIPDIIRDQETGLLVQQKSPGDLAEKINRVFTDEDLRQRLSEKGHSFVMEHFSWPVIAKSYLELFRSVLQEKGRRKNESGY